CANVLGPWGSWSHYFEYW
nr:immunoglobulin heavy chain junction region [Macaca mulatta]MOX58746.1 immunoglobulin heavy chain junction region [Macaca mulatta]MOX59258.1 immunoglobulin heavy chain junction region [Macaca mulatta]MOX60033.1 immunoglobulin heavy chain junction region [Macaca mulatta]MOX60490.1 immunoglobulin heavy chain junction region [Macaca mulatta]